MNAIARPTPPGPVVYPDSDGMPMAENTLQYQWIVTLRENIALVLLDRPALVAADNLIYPVEGHLEICQAPDVYVALGRPPGHRSSYKVWEEGNVFPQVVFEILSPSNRGGALTRKFLFYQRHGAQEYYIYDPDSNELWGWRRADGELEEIPDLGGWVSPLLGIRFDPSGPELVLFRPDGQRFLTFAELANLADAEKHRADAEKHRADAEKHRADAEKHRADALAAKLRELGIDPDAV